MKELKTEAFKKAYGKYYEALKQYMDANGWVHDDYISLDMISDIYFETTDFGMGNSKFLHYRPVVLKGIDDNNGWLLIEDYKEGWSIVITIDYEGKQETTELMAHELEANKKKYFRWKPINLSGPGPVI